MIHGPEWTDAPTADWVRAWSRGTGFVYPDHGRLWLTLSALGSEFRLPIDSRRLIESVYGSDSINLPNGLAEVTRRANAADERNAGIGAMNSIPPGSAYETDDRYRWPDEQAPTRLGEPTREWVLCLDGKPLCGSIERSTIALRASQLQSADGDPAIKVDPWRRTIALRREGDRFLGRGSNPRGPVTLSYSDKTGLRIS